MILVLDTNAYSDWRRAGRWNENLALAKRIIVPVTVMGELDFGFIKGSKTSENRKRLQHFLAQPQVEVSCAGEQTAAIYAELRFYLQQMGKPIPANDIWIAASAVEYGGELAARDGHFDELPMVKKAVEIFP
jgi:predicted nucleic acid-binding protein